MGSRSLERRIRTACWATIVAMTVYSVWGFVGGYGAVNALIVAVAGAAAGSTAAWRQK
jgi:hypothetical protein